jgi:hypothetical protein
MFVKDTGCYFCNGYQYVQRVDDHSRIRCPLCDEVNTSTIRKQEEVINCLKLEAGQAQNVIATITAERDGWKETARLYAANVDFWRDENSKHLAERDDLLNGHNKYSSDPTKCCVPMTDFLRVKNECDALRSDLNMLHTSKSVTVHQDLFTVMQERDALKAATLRVLEALHSYRTWMRDEQGCDGIATCRLCKSADAALADPVIVALRRE